MARSNRWTPNRGNRARHRLTLSALMQRFVTEGRYLPDGSLKTETYLRHCARTGRYLCTFFGRDFDPQYLTPHRVGEYVRARRVGEINGRVVGTNCVKQEVMILKAALTWACGVYTGKTPLLGRNALTGWKVPREKNPKRPILDEESVERLGEVAEDVHEFFPCLLSLACHTGRRISAILGLKWDDIDFEQGTIRWRAETDKKRKEWITPIPTRVLKELTRHLDTHPAIGAALLFPHPKNRRKAVDRHLAAYWLDRALTLAKVDHPDGGRWHVFRRAWATARKHLPVQDVAAAGGWSDLNTLLTVYQQPDEETMREVMEYQRPRKRSWRPNPMRPTIGRATIGVNKKDVTKTN
jgi:integrase